jgi:hypothetical protein
MLIDSFRYCLLPPSCGIRSPDRPARSESLYRLSYPALHRRREICYSDRLENPRDYFNSLGRERFNIGENARFGVLTGVTADVPVCWDDAV